MFADLNPGGDNLFISEILGIGADVFFTAYGTLSKSDGTRAGTSIIDETTPSPGSLTDLGGVLYFASYERWGPARLMMSDGSAGGTEQVTDGIRSSPVS